MSWPAAVVAGICAGSALHMDSAADLNYWPVLILAAVYFAASAGTLQPPRQKAHGAPAWVPAPAPSFGGAMPAVQLMANPGSPFAAPGKLRNEPPADRL